jgi:hypothetical protein
MAKKYDSLHGKFASVNPVGEGEIENGNRNFAVDVNVSAGQSDRK